MRNRKELEEVGTTHDTVNRQNESEGRYRVLREAGYTCN